MKIAVISDLHLGFRQYGSLEREIDFYNQFLKVCNEINKQAPEMVIIAGDLFDKPNPSPSAINAYKKGIKSLKAETICVIKGNHTMLLRDNHYAIDDFFGEDEFEGYYFLDDSSISKENIVVDGITYRPNSNITEFLQIQENFAEHRNKDTYNILVVHQSFKEFCGFTGEELSIEDIYYLPYDVVVCGHIHSRFHTKLQNGTWFIQPGSIERMNTTEALDEQKNGKGFYLIDTDDNTVSFFEIKCEREFLLGEIILKEEKDIEKHLDDIEKITTKTKLAPIISYTYKNHIKNIVQVREKIGQVQSNVLLNKSNIYDETEEEIVLEITDNEIPTVFEAINMAAKKMDFNKDEITLIKELHESLNNDVENGFTIANNYYNKNKKEVPIEEFYDKELEELIKYFERL